VLWEVLACRRLFKGEGEADTLNRVLNEPIPPVRSVAPMIPAALEAVVAKALDRDRSKRYATSAEFADALERASRVVGALGTHKDVAGHLDAVLGTDISAQRDAVRAWLARSEPSRHGADVPGRPEPTSVTRVEGRAAGEGTPSGMSSVPRLAAQGPPSGSVSAVSSVSSAIIPAPAPAPALPALDMAPARRRGRVWPWALALVAAGVAVAAWMGRSRLPLMIASAPPAASAAVAAPPVSAPPPVTTAVPAASAASAAPSAHASATAMADAAPLATASARPPAAVVPPAPVRTWWHPPPRAASPAPVTAGAQPTAAPSPAPAPAPSPAPAPVPDDISRNPYR
jgi:eukaryotic-like serine/threonine-protein kinase